MKDDQLWKAALGQLELRVSQGNFLTWFRQTKIKECRQGKVLIETDNPFAYEWLSKKYRGIILEVLQNLDQKIQEVEFFVSSLTTQRRPLRKNFHILAEKQRLTSHVKTEREVPAVMSQAQQERLVVHRSNKTLNPKYTFDTFVIGPSNEIAHAACRATASKPGKVYNPLFIYGGVGLGKTHLLQAVGNELLREGAATKIFFVSSERFINEFVEAIRERKTKEFRNKYREVDVLIIDDVQFLAGKAKTQEELFHTFNALQGQGKQVILSSDRPPSAIPTLQERLSSRLGSGMIADIKKPDYETRLAILAEKAAARNVPIDSDALAYIAKNIQSNVRDLEGALNRVVGYCELNNQRATLVYTQKILESVLVQTQHKTVGGKQILDTVSVYYDLSIDDLCGKCRKKEIVRPRQIAMYLLRKENNMSFPSIGDFFGGRDHTTAMHACQKIEKLLEHDEELVQEVNFLRERIYA